MAGQRPLAVVTGASGGIGLELAREAARDGHDLLLVARNEARLQEIAAELSAAHGVRAEAFALDLARPDAAAILGERLEADGRPVDVLVNNAGYSTFGRFVELEAQRELDMLQVNVMALTAVCKLVLPGM